MQEVDYKERDRKLLLEYLSGRGDVDVDRLAAESGIEPLRVFPLLFELVQDGKVEVVSEGKLGAPAVVRLVR